MATAVSSALRDHSVIGFMSAICRVFVSTAAVAMAALFTARLVNADAESDREECAALLAGLATCLPYVQGGAVAPTPDCCSGLKGVLARSPKCLCVLVKDRDDPGLGIKLNLTRALFLPASCGAPANISRCPELLNLPPNSPDAQVFKNLTAGSNATDNKGGGRGGVHGTSAGERLHSSIPIGGSTWPGVGDLFPLMLLAAFAAN